MHDGVGRGDLLDQLAPGSQPALPLGHELLDGLRRAQVVGVDLVDDEGELAVVPAQQAEDGVGHLLDGDGLRLVGGQVGLLGQQPGQAQRLVGR